MFRHMLPSSQPGQRRCSLTTVRSVPSSELDREALLVAYDSQVRAAETPHLADGASTERDGPVIRIVGQYRGFVSGPVDLGVDGADLDALIARQRDVFAARGEAVEWKTRGHDRPADLTDHLLAAGFVPEEQETVMIAVAADLADPDPPLPGGVTIRRTAAEHDMDQIAVMESTVWGIDLSWMAGDLAGRMRRDPEQLVVLVAEAGGEVVSAAWLALPRDIEFAGLWGGATLEGWRGHGIYRALVARRAVTAEERGVRYLQVDASEDSRPILERLGFVAITTTTPYVWTPPSATGPGH
jgi:GNAT superfamily N-acetyltransferase